MSTTALTEALRLLGGGHSLDSGETQAAVGEILSGDAGEAAVAAFLTALHVKGETAAELTGAVAAVRSRVETAGLSPAPPGAIDTCGTGGDGANTVNISTATALVVAACGVPVVKHGNRSASGNSGSAEVLTELGIAVDADPALLSKVLAELGITFLLAPKFHPGLRHAGLVRRQLPFRTIFNLVGPLANPLNPSFQLVGVSGERQAGLVAGALARLGTTRSAVVTGSDGLDEVSLAGPTSVRLVEGGHVTPFLWEPSDFGLGPVAVGALRVSGPAESAGRIRRLLAGDPGPDREMVLANAAASLWVAGRCGEDLKVGVAQAADAVDSGCAGDLLDRWRKALEPKAS